jgi:hypothetical protein
MNINDLKICCLLMVSLSTTVDSFAREFTAEDLVSSKEKIQSAIVKFEKTDSEHWSYIVSRFEDEEGDITSSIEYFSPQEDKPWLLKKINGEQPTEKQISQFAKKKHDQSSKKGEGVNVQIKLRNLINQESLSLVSIDNKNIVMAFDVSFKKLGEDSRGKLQGQLTYQKDAKFIEKISVWNNENFSPMFTANITDLAITFTFLEINGSVLTKQNEMKMKGSFAYFTDINETSLDTFSGYQYHGK